MSRARTLRREIGRVVVVYMGHGDEAVSGTLLRVTNDDIILEAHDEFGDPLDMKHVVPWDTVFRIMTMPEDYTPPEEDLPEPPEWVSEMIMGWAKEEAEKRADDGTIPGRQPEHIESREEAPTEGERTPEAGTSPSKAGKPNAAR